MHTEEKEPLSASLQIYRFLTPSRDRDGWRKSLKPMGEISSNFNSCLQGMQPYLSLTQTQILTYCFRPAHSSLVHCAENICSFPFRINLRTVKKNPKPISCPQLGYKCSLRLSTYRHNQSTPLTCIYRVPAKAATKLLLCSDRGSHSPTHWKKAQGAVVVFMVLRDQWMENTELMQIHFDFVNLF